VVFGVLKHPLRSYLVPAKHVPGQRQVMKVSKIHDSIAPLEIKSARTCLHEERHELVLCSQMIELFQDKICGFRSIQLGGCDCRANHKSPSGRFAQGLCALPSQVSRENGGREKTQDAQGTESERAHDRIVLSYSRLAETPLET
jgi:hypothetical protein